VIPRGFCIGTSVHCMFISPTSIFPTVVLTAPPRGGMVMLNGPKSTTGDVMQKLPLSIVMSPRLLV